jgi:hypothetical protein
MSTRETIKAYFAQLATKGDWQSYFADDVLFTSLTNPGRQLRSKNLFVEGTKRFYGSFSTVEVKELLVDGAKACALTTYSVRNPMTNQSFESNVAEFFEVQSDKIVSFSICFDTAPFPK